MRTLIALALSLALLSPPSLVLAQGSANPGPSTQNSDRVKDPEDRGATGWTGGAREPEKVETTGAGSRKSDEELAADQPAHASGVDLQGPPVRFPPSKTPE